MIISITGGSGFIGKRLALRHIERGDEVRVLTRGIKSSTLDPRIKRHTGDLTDSLVDLSDFLQGVDVLYHCAAELNDASKMEALNVDGTAKLIAAATGVVAHWVQLSSVGAYGPVRSGLVTEESPERSLGAYEVTKTKADNLLRLAATKGAFTYAMLRPSTVFGNDMPNQSLVQWVQMIRRGLFFFIGKRGAMLNYVHVDSVVDALVLCGLSEAAKGGTYIMSESIEIEHFVTLIASALGRNPPKIRVPALVARLVSAIGCLLSRRFPLTPSRIDALTGDAIYMSTRIRQDLSYVPSVDLSSGLKSFVYG